MRTFISLRQEEEIFNYRDEAAKCAEKFACKLEHKHLPIPDFSTLPDREVEAFLAKTVPFLLASPSCSYLHCLGGHGRTGTILALILGRVFGVSSDLALAWVKRTHAGRALGGQKHSPETPAQFAQVTAASVCFCVPGSD